MTAPDIFVSQLDQCQRQKHTYPAERRSPHHNKTAGKQSIIRESCHKYHFCRDKRQTYLCRDKISNAILSRQTFCRGKHTFVATKTCFVATNMSLRRQNTSLVATKVCLSVVTTRVCPDKRSNVIRSRQTRVCRDKNYTCSSYRQ